MSDPQAQGLGPGSPSRAPPSTASSSTPRMAPRSSPEQRLSPGMAAGSPASGSPGELWCALSLRQENASR